jgi:flagellar hook-associated protein 1 FlgK
VTQGLRIALSSLQAQRRAMEVLGQNIANVGTEGYSRQRVSLVSDTGGTVPAVFATANTSGNGVLVGSVVRLRDSFLEARALQEHAVSAGLDRTKASLDRIELGFGEPGETGISSQLADFLAAWDDVASRPDDLVARRSLIERGRTLASSFTSVDGTLGALGQSSVEQLTAGIDEVDALAARVAELNGRIQVAVMAGSAPNDLADERDRLIGTLAQRVGVTTRDGEGGMVDVFVDGNALVRGVHNDALKVDVTAGVASVQWTRDGRPAAVGGEAGALVAIASDIVPRYRNGLAAVAQQVHDDVNALHQTGVALDGTTNHDFFTMVNGTIEVDPAILANAALVAAAGVGGATRDGSVARKLAKLTGPEVTYRDLVVGLGVESQTAARRLDIQSKITTSVDAARQSASGVDLDEEMTEMLGVQHAYQAASRLMTAVDEMMDTLINRTGMAGR